MIAFAGQGSREITIDGRRTVFAERPLEQIAWAPVSEQRRTPGGAVLQIIASGEGEVYVPMAWWRGKVELVAEGPTPGSRGLVVPCRQQDGQLVFTLTREIQQRWLYAVPVRDNRPQARRSGCASGRGVSSKPPNLLHRLEDFWLLL